MLPVANSTALGPNNFREECKPGCLEGRRFVIDPAQMIVKLEAPASRSVSMAAVPVPAFRDAVILVISQLGRSLEKNEIIQSDAILGGALSEAAGRQGSGRSLQCRQG